MPKSTSSRSFDGSAARNVSEISEQPISESTRKTSRRREMRGVSDLPEELDRLRAERDAEEEVSKIRRKMGMPSPGANAVLAIEHANTLLAGPVTEQDLARTREELLLAKNGLESAVMKMRAMPGNDEALNEYYGHIREMEGLLDVVSHHEPSEIDEAMTEMKMRQNAGTNAAKLAEYALEKRGQVQEKIQPVIKELNAAKAELKAAILDQGVMDEKSELRRIDETLKEGGWGALKLRIGDRLRQLSGSPSILALRQKVEGLELKKDLMRGEMAEFTDMAHSSPESGLASPKVRTSKAELRRDADRREDRLEPQGKTAEELEKDYFDDGSIEVDLSELEEEEPVNLVKIKAKPTTPEPAPEGDLDFSDMEEDEPLLLVKKKKPTKPLALPKEIQELAAQGAKKLEKRHIALGPRIEVGSTITIVEAQQLVPEAARLWDTVNGELQNMPKYDVQRFNKLMGAMQGSSEIPQTKFVLEVARLAKARKDGVDEKSLKILRENLDKGADMLGIYDTPLYLRLTDKEFDDAMSRIPHPDQFIELINTKTGMDADYVGVTSAARNYLVAMGEYRKAVDNGDQAGQNSAWEKINDMNEVLGIAKNALVQMTIGEIKRPKDVLKGTKQRRDAVARSNKRWNI